MKFNEFKPQLTEEQIVLAYCKGEITKENAVSQLSEVDWRDIANKVTWGAIDSRAEQDAQDKAGYSLSDTFAMPGKAAQATQAKRDAAAARGIKSSSDALASAPGASPASAIKALTGLDFGSNAANAATPPTTPTPGPAVTQNPAYNQTGMDDVDMPQPKPAAPAPRAKVKATAANTRDYDKTVALQKKLGVTADGIMGPNTRAAMKAAGMATTTPGSKVKTPGPAVTQNPAYNQTGMDDVDMPQPKPTPKPKPKMPKAFGIGPRVDDPKGGETVKTPFGFSYKTLPQNNDVSD